MEFGSPSAIVTRGALPLLCFVRNIKPDAWVVNTGQRQKEILLVFITAAPGDENDMEMCAPY